MKRSILDLIALQNVDLRIRDLETRLKNIPAERAELVAEFEVVKKALAAAEAQVKQTEMKIRTIEGEIEAAKAHLTDIRLRSPSIKKVAEYNAAMADIAATEKKISQLEDSAIEAMESLEKAKAGVERAARNYRATGRSVQKEVRDLDAFKETIRSELETRTAESAELEKKVAIATLPAYKRLLASGKGSPVGTVMPGGLCSNCSLKIPPMTLVEAKKGNLVSCDNCSHLVYDPNCTD